MGDIVTVLTDDKLSEIMQFIIRHKIDNGGNSPSYRQIKNSCQLSGTSIVQTAIQQLIEQGRLSYTGISAKELIVPDLVITYLGDEM